MRLSFILTALSIVLLVAGNHVHGHGSVLMEDDVCVIKVGFLDAHFTAYQPGESGTKEFCEDLPDVSESVFVIEYLHEFLKDMPVDFRIIKDVEDFGYYANWDDIQSMDDIAAATVFYQPPKRERSGVYRVNHAFEESGVYIGIVSARNPADDKIYRSVFPFLVGTTNWGLIPLFVVLVVAAHFAYLYLNKRWNVG